jgi:lon-related putative ATP-dependent protease
MPEPTINLELTPDELRWRLDPATLGFATTDDLQPLDDIIGQDRAVDAFKFGMGMDRAGYNIFVTGPAGHGRMATVKKLLRELPSRDGVPEDLCYVNNFKDQDAPILLRFKAGGGREFRKDMREFLDNLKREVPLLFESEEYVTRKREIMESHEKKVREFFKSLEDKVKDTGLALVSMQIGPVQRPDLVPIVDGNPVRMVDLEDLVDKGRFPKEEYERLKAKRDELKEQIDRVVEEVKNLQKEVRERHEEVDKQMFLAMAREYLKAVRAKYEDKKVQVYLDSVLDNMVENLDTIRLLGGAPQGAPGGMPFMNMTPPPEAILHPYQVNLVVDNAEQTGPPVIIESYPTYRNLFGSIDRVMSQMGGWRTDYTMIKAGSFVRANGGYLVINLMDAIMEPAVWPTLKRSLKTEKIEIETYDPYYFIAGAGLHPEPIGMDVKVVVLGEPQLYMMLRYYDPDTSKIFKVRADYETVMDNSGGNAVEIARFIRAEAEKNKLLPFAAGAVARVVEQAVRWAGRQEKLSTAFPHLADLLAEADHFARRDASPAVEDRHVEQAIEARIRRTNQIEDRIQEMIDRGSLFIDTDGAVVGQVNGLAVYSMGDYAFGKPARITATTSLGKEGIINIEREANMAGPTHNKGMLILAGYLRRRFAQDKPMALAASITFEQSYGGVDGDSASSTELYALLSSLSEVPIRQYIAVTGSVNQKGEVQPIGGVNEKVEGFYLCCKHAGLNGRQGCLIPRPNVKDLQLKPEVVEAVRAGTFHLWAVSTIDQGIEVLTGMPAGEADKDGKYPEGTINSLVDRKLHAMVTRMMEFGKEGEDKKVVEVGKPEPPKAPDPPRPPSPPEPPKGRE